MVNEKYPIAGIDYPRTFQTVRRKVPARSRGAVAQRAGQRREYRQPGHN